jgi:hypothetical protein
MPRTLKREDYVCPVCDGRGRVPGRLPGRDRLCDECHGTGRITPIRREQLLKKMAKERVAIAANLVPERQAGLDAPRLRGMRGSPPVWGSSLPWRGGSMKSIGGCREGQGGPQQYRGDLSRLQIRSASSLDLSFSQARILCRLADCHPYYTIWSTDDSRGHLRVEHGTNIAPAI